PAQPTPTLFPYTTLFRSHGGERGRMKWMASQVGAEILIMEEKDASAYSFTVDPDVRNAETSQGMRYNPKYKEIQNWATPRNFERSEEHTSELQSRFDLVC